MVPVSIRKAILTTVEGVISAVMCLSGHVRAGRASAPALSTLLAGQTTACPWIQNVAMRPLAFPVTPVSAAAVTIVATHHSAAIKVLVAS
jgi:hypothetical protein